MRAFAGIIWRILFLPQWSTTTVQLSRDIPPSLVDTSLARRGVASGEVPPIEIMAQHMPIAHAGTPEDIANACVFLCSDQASYITGQEINVNGWMYM